MICAGEAVKAERARETRHRLRRRAERAAARRGRRACCSGRAEDGDWKQSAQQKQQPVGLSEEQATFTFAVARGQVLAKTKGQLPAPLAALEAIEKGCNLPLDEGLKVETDAFVPLVGSPISRNLIAIFFMTQRLAKDPGVADADVQPRDVEQVGVVGAGIMGAGIAGAHVRRGVPAVMLDSVPAGAGKGRRPPSPRSMQSRIEIGRMTPEDMVGALALLSTSTDACSALADRDVVIEAVVENEEVKTKLYRELQTILPPDAILASNTSTISITRMAKAVDRSRRTSPACTSSTPSIACSWSR